MWGRGQEYKSIMSGKAGEKVEEVGEGARVQEYYEWESR